MNRFVIAPGTLSGKCAECGQHFSRPFSLDADSGMIAEEIALGMRCASCPAPKRDVVIERRYEPIEEGIQRWWP